MIEIQLLGGFALGGDAATPQTRKAVFLLACLAMRQGRPETRERLAALLWSDRAEAQARASLRQALAELRRCCGTALHADARVVALDAAALSCDATTFLDAASADTPATIARAAGLYRGALLEGLDAPDPGMVDWLRTERERLHRAALALLDKAVAQAPEADAAQAAAVAALARRLLAADPTAEEAHRALIALALAGGRTTEALRLYDACAATLRQEFGIEPEAATRDLAERARHPETAAAAAPVHAATAPGPPRDGPSIVVMPFENHSGDPGQEAFVDGIVEEVTGALARMRDFFVIARPSANALKGEAAHDIRQVGRMLGVRYVLEGSVRRAGRRVRIGVTLVDAEQGTHLWTERFDGEVADVFDFQDEIAARVAGAVHPSLRAAEVARARRKRPGSLAAYDRVMRAYPHLWAHTRDDNHAAMALLRDALAENPDYGLAAALLAWCHAQETSYLWSGNIEADRLQAVALCERAARLTDDDATALVAIGAAYSQVSEDFDLAESFVQRSLEIDRNNAWGWARGGWVNVYRGEWETARERFARARRLSPLDPLDFNISFGLAAVGIGSEDFAGALEHVERGLRAKPGLVWPLRLLAVAAALAGDLDKARRATARFLAAHPDMTIGKIRAAVPRGIVRNQKRYWEGLRLAGMPED